MSNRKYMDYELVRKYPNKYNLTPKLIKKLIIADWDRLKTKTWQNQAMKKTGTWWCHLEGSNLPGKKYEEDDEFWIGFREEDGKIDCNFSCYEGMCRYKFDEFYNVDEIENRFDMQVQVNTIIWLNMMIDEGILALPEKA